ncbi:hypothetical protein L7F22_009542 [Adiantum nelumboides]|nr:hypothetical protein [Adiantum nelumboides]
MVELAEKEGRVLLTQDANLLRRGFIPRNYAYRVKSNGKQEQLAEVVKVLNLEILEDNLLSRCNKCNGEFFPKALTPEEALATVSGGQTIPHYAIEERVMFWQCSQCLHMYWQVASERYLLLQNAGHLRMCMRSLQAVDEPFNLDNHGENLNTKGYSLWFGNFGKIDELGDEYILKETPYFCRHAK